MPGHGHTSETRAKIAASVSASWTPERKRAVSERMKAEGAARRTAEQAALEALLSPAEAAARAKRRAAWTPERRAALSAKNRAAYIAQQAAQQAETPPTSLPCGCYPLDPFGCDACR